MRLADIVQHEIHVIIGASTGSCDVNRISATLLNVYKNHAHTKGIQHPKDQHLIPIISTTIAESVIMLDAAAQTTEANRLKKTMILAQNMHHKRIRHSIPSKLPLQVKNLMQRSTPEYAPESSEKILWTKAFDR